MRILVIGGTRFIGLATVHHLVAQGHDVAVYHRGHSEPELPETVRHIHSGGEQPFSVHFSPESVAAFRQYAPDVVIHMVLMSEQDAQESLNIFKGMASRFIMVSSQDVYRAFGRINHQESGALDPLPLTEDSALRTRLYPHRFMAPSDPASPRYWMNTYDKIPAERLLLDDPDLATTVLRLPMVYGPNDGQHRTFPYLKRMNDGRPVILLDEAEASWRWTHGYVENVGGVIALAALDERASQRIYNVGEPETCTMEEWVRQIAAVAGWKGRIVKVPQGRLAEPLAMGVDAAQDIVVDTTRIRQELGYSEAIPLDEALRRTIAWERANPPATFDPGAFDYAEEDRILAELK